MWAAGLDAVRDVPVVVVLGERGSGKSVALDQERVLLDEAGLPYTFVHLGTDVHVYDTASARERLTHALRPHKGDPGGDDLPVRFVLLDGLDEALNTISDLDKLVAGLLRGLTEQERAVLRLRFACRTTRWPPLLDEVLREVWPTAANEPSKMALATLTPLDHDDIRMAAASHNVDGDEFLDVLASRGLEALAQQPVTLGPLLRAREDGEDLPATAAEAYRQACRRLCAETSWKENFAVRRRRSSPDHLVAVAGWTAAALQFGRHTALSDNPGESAPAPHGDLPLDTLARPRVPGPPPAHDCGPHQLSELTESGLLTPVGPQRWVFAHRSYQEFLAAEFLKACSMKPVVLGELLWAGDGDARHVLPEHEEVAARLAVDDPRLFDEICRHDPRVLLLADLRAVRPGQRAHLVGALLEHAARDDARIDTPRLAGLAHPGLAAQLRPFLAPDTHPAQRYVALWMAATCRPPGLAPDLLAVAEDPALPVHVRAFALDCLHDPGNGDVPRLRSLAADPFAAVAEAALWTLWPAFVSVTEYLDLLPDRGWLSHHWLSTATEHITAGHADAALEWSIAVLEAKGRKAVLATAVVAACIEAVFPDPAPASGSSLVRRAGRALAAIADHDELLHTGDARDAYDLLALALSRISTERRRYWAEQVLLHTSPDAALGFIFEDAGKVLFPTEDLLHWATRWPELPETARRAAQPLFSRRPRPQDPELRTAVDQARDIDSELRVGTAWWDAPEPAWETRRRERREERQRCNTFDPAALAVTLEAVDNAPPETVRQAWRTVVAHLYRTSDGSDPTQEAVLRAVAAAPSCPPPGTAGHTRLVAAATRVLATAPIVTAEDCEYGHPMRGTPELLALAFVGTDTANTAVPRGDTRRWAGWAAALAAARTATQEQALRRDLLRACASHAGTAFEDVLAPMLDRLEEHTLSGVVRALDEAELPDPRDVVRRWALEPGRAPDSWEPALSALAHSGDPEAVEHLTAVATSDPGDDPDGRERWLRAAVIMMTRDGLPTLWPAIRRGLDQPGLWQELVNRITSYRPRTSAWLAQAATLNAPDLADLYLRVCALDELAHPRPDHEPGVAYSVTQHEALHDLADALPGLIAEKGTRQAAAALENLAELPATHLPEYVRKLAHRTARAAAREHHGPIPTRDLGRMADDGDLRFVADEIQLLDVVLEALDKVQEALSDPNGLATLLWNRTHASPRQGSWWPKWEDDFSDLVKSLLDIHLAPDRVIINREVQVTRPGLEEGGRTDIHIQATNRNIPGPFTVVIECKGCWNKDLPNAITDQLVRRYLHAPRTAGILLVGYFDCDLWDTRHRAKCSAQHHIDEIEQQQAKLAAAQKPAVRARVLDCRPGARFAGSD